MSSIYVDILRRHEMEPSLRGSWAVARNTPRVQGWKLHLSSIPTQAESFLERVVPLLGDSTAGFKVVCDPPTLRRLNEGVLGGTQIGKFLTVYPQDDHQARELAEMLVAATTGFEGPSVLTDLFLGGTVYARYGGFNPIIVRDRLGQVSRMIRTPDGALQRDDYVVPFQPPVSWSNPFEGLVQAPVASPWSNGSRLFGPGYLLLRTLKSDPKGSVFLAIDLRSQKLVRKCVLKEGRRFCLSDEIGRDMRSRLRHQHRLLSRLQGKASVPAVGDYFEWEGHGYLPVEHIEGRSLAASAQAYGLRPAAARRRLLEQLLEVVDAVESLHENGVVHRDLTLSNVVCTDGSVLLLDVELAWEVGSGEPPFTQGTPGFMSPQQEAGQPPSFADDVFALSSLLAAVLTGLDPRRLKHGNGDRARMLRHLSGVPAPLAEVLAAGWREDPGARPGLADLRAALRQALAIEAPEPPGGTEETAEISLGPPLARRIIRSSYSPAARLLERAALGLQRDVLLDSATGLWLSPPLQGGEGGAENRASEYAVYRSASRGVAGVLYVLARLSRELPSGAVDQDWIGTVVDWLLAHHPTPDDQLPGLHFGEAGVAVAVAEAVSAGLVEGGRWFEDYLAEALAGPLDWPDVTHGAAGQGIAALACADLTGDPRLLSFASRAAGYLCEVQDPDGGWTLPAGVEAMEGARYTGFAHGTAGITYFLAEYAGRSGDEVAEKASLAGARWLLLRAVGAGRALAWPVREDGEESWSWWCHGGPGIALTLLKLYQRTGDARYADATRRALAAHPFEVRFSNLSLCHGLSGLGEAYLEAARILGEERWWLRACRLGEILGSLAGRGAHGGATWLVEDPHRPTGDLMVGCGGVAHFLLRLARGSASFSHPLLPSDAPG